ncbi:MAG TPA: oligosaccharide flippase family protein [Gemmatimonadaceae bacterium]|nr:oligosaccharide flippase family protein [Gemmatimonadaceae bacterium]
MVAPNKVVATDADSPLGGLTTRFRRLVRPGSIEGALTRGALLVFTINVAGTLIAFLVQLLLARTLGPAEYGVYIYTLGIFNIVLLVAKVDWDHVSLRFLSAYTAQQNRGLLRGFLRRSDSIVGLASGVAAALAAIMVWIFRGSVSPSLFAAYLVACALLPITAFLQVKALALQGLRRVVASQAPLSVMRPSLFAAGVILAAFVFDRRLTAASALILNAAATAAVLIVSSRLLSRATKHETSGVAPQYATREWLHVAWGMFVVSAGQFVLSQSFDVVVVGSMLGTTVAGYYGAASQLAGLCGFGVNAVLFMAAPLISELFASGDKPKLQRLITLTGRLNVAVSLPVVLALVFAGRLILSWYGPPFVTAYPVLVVLVAGQLTGAMLGALAGFLMTMTGHHNRAAVIIGASALLYLLLTFVLTRLFGAVGTAASTVIAFLARHVVLEIDIRRRLGIEAFPFGKAPRKAAAQTAAPGR